MLFYGALLLVGYLGYQIVQPFLVADRLGAGARDLPRPGADAARAPHRPAARGRALLTVLALLLLFLPALAIVSALVRQGPAVVDYVHGQLIDRGGPMGLFHIVWDWLHQRLPSCRRRTTSSAASRRASVAWPAASRPTPAAS